MDTTTTTPDAPPAGATAPHGDTGIAKSLFLGRIAHARLHPYPAFDAREREVVAPMIDALDDFMSQHTADFRA